MAANRFRLLADRMWVPRRCTLGSRRLNATRQAVWSDERRARTDQGAERENRELSQANEILPEGPQHISHRRSSTAHSNDDCLHRRSCDCLLGSSDLQWSCPIAPIDILRPHRIKAHHPARQQAPRVPARCHPCAAMRFKRYSMTTQVPTGRESLAPDAARRL